MKKLLGIVMIIIGAFLSVGGFITKVAGYLSFAMINSADGPTAVFIAGQLGDTISDVLLIMGGILFVFAGVVLFKRKR